VKARKRRGWEGRTELDEYRGLCLTRIKYLVEVREPFVLVAQIQRSGGSLMTRLFDGHPECHAHLGDLDIGRKRSRWPEIDLDADPDEWFEILYEKNAHKNLRRSLRGVHVDLPSETNPLLFLPMLQRTIFERCLASRRVETARDVFDCFWTSYFNAWLDNHNLYTGPKKVVVGFGHRFQMNPGSPERFWDVYPDGRLISIVRDPCGWYASARTHGKDYVQFDKAIDLWRRSAEATLDAAERYAGQVVVLTYEDLVAEPEDTMRRVAEAVGITWSPVLLTPTYNGGAVLPNSTEGVQERGIVKERATAYRTSLDSSTVERIRKVTGDLYERARECALARA
jgi:hypothetical protein